MSLLGFGFYEKLCHSVEDSVQKEKGRVEADKFILIKENEAFTSTHASISKPSSSMLRLYKQRDLFWRENFRDSLVKHTV